MARYVSHLPEGRSLCWRIAILALAGIVCAGRLAAQPVADGDTLLLVQFDHGADAVFARGDPTANGTCELVPGRFGKGILLSPGRTIQYCGNDGNFHAQEGTIEFWMAPRWAGDVSDKHSVFSCQFGSRGYINVNTVGTGTLGIAISSGEGEQWTWRRADADIRQWKPNEWHYVACTWGTQSLRIFVDGVEGRRSAIDARMPDALPETLQLLGGDVVLDAFQISGRAFSPDEIAVRYRASLQPPPYRDASELVASVDEAAVLRSRPLPSGYVSLPLLLAGKRYPHAFAIAPTRACRLTLNGQWDRFRAIAGLDTLSPENTSVSLEIRGDGDVLWRQDELTPNGEPVRIDLTVANVRQLTLSTTSTQESAYGPLWVFAKAVVARTDAKPVFAPPRELTVAQLAMYRRQQAADRYECQLDSDQPFVIASKFWEDDLDPAQDPTVLSEGEPLTLSAAPDESEPVNFVIYALRDLETVSVSVSDLSATSHVVPAEGIELRLVMRGLMRNLYTRPPEESTVVSRFLLPLRSVDIPAGTLREYHLIVHVPPNTPPGDYHGTVAIRVKGERPRVVPLTLHVRPIQLRPLKHVFYGIYYRFPTSDLSDTEQIDIELQDIRQHGASTVKWPLGVRYGRRADGTIDISVDQLKQGLALLRKHGFHGPLPVSTGCEALARLLSAQGKKPPWDSNETFLAAVRRGMARLDALAQSFPEFEFLPTHMDEIFGRDRLDLYIQYTRAVRAATSRRVYITLHNAPRKGLDVEGMMARCDPFVDVRCYNGHAMDDWIRAGHSFRELDRQLKSSGDEAWTYYNIRGSFFRPEWTRLVNGFYLWVSPLRAHVPWMYYSFSGNPLDDTDGPRERGHDFAYAVPDPQQPNAMIPTRHWEAFREGIDDMRYLSTLEELIELHPQAEAAGRARALLTALRRNLTPVAEQLAQIEGESPILIAWSEAWNGKDYRRLRDEIASLIDELQR